MNPDTVQISLRLSPQHAEWLRKLAEIEHRSMNQEVAKLIAEKAAQRGLPSNASSVSARLKAV